MNQSTAKKREFLERLCEFYGAKCFYCGTTEEELLAREPGRLARSPKAGQQPAFCLDHVIPRKPMGPGAIWNLVPSCIECTSKKGNDSIFAFAPEKAEEWLARSAPLREGVKTRVDQLVRYERRRAAALKEVGAEGTGPTRRHEVPTGVSPLWRHVDEINGRRLAVEMFVIEVPQVEVELEARPSYCDRGRWVAKVFPRGALAMDLDGADGFPRYYFDLGRAMAEIEEWLRFRKLLED